MAGRNATKAMIFALDSYNVYDIPAPYGKDINDYLCYSIGIKRDKKWINIKRKMDKIEYQYRYFLMQIGFLVLASTEFVHTKISCFKILYNGASPNPLYKFELQEGKFWEKDILEKI